MTTFKFKTEHFIDRDMDSLEYADLAADIANATLEAHLATCKRVYGIQNESGLWSFHNERLYATEDKHNFDTHTAVLFNVQPLKQEPCKGHEPANVGSGCMTDIANIKNQVCKHCGVALRVLWEPCE